MQASVEHICKCAMMLLITHDAFLSSFLCNLYSPCTRVTVALPEWFWHCIPDLCWVEYFSPDFSAWVSLWLKLMPVHHFFQPTARWLPCATIAEWITNCHRFKHNVVANVVRFFILWYRIKKLAEGLCNTMPNFEINSNSNSSFHFPHSTDFPLYNLDFAILYLYTDLLKKMY